MIVVEGRSCKHRENEIEIFNVILLAIFALAMNLKTINRNDLSDIHETDDSNVGYLGWLICISSNAHLLRLKSIGVHCVQLFYL